MSHHTLGKAIHIPNIPMPKGKSSKPAKLLRLKKKKGGGGARSGKKKSLHTIHYPYTVDYICQSQTSQKTANGHLIS